LPEYHTSLGTSWINEYLFERLRASFLTRNSTSSSSVGCGAVELIHPVGGMVYRTLKSSSLRTLLFWLVTIAITIYHFLVMISLTTTDYDVIIMACTFSRTQTLQYYTTIFSSGLPSPSTV